MLVFVFELPTNELSFYRALAGVGNFHEIWLLLLLTLLFSVNRVRTEFFNAFISTALPASEFLTKITIFMILQ